MRDKRAKSRQVRHSTQPTQRGSTIPLIVGLGVVALLAAVMVIDASAAWIQRQSLTNLADGAALYAADQGAKGREVYTQGLGTELRVTPAEARAAVADFLDRGAARAEFPGLRYDVSVGEGRVVVSLQAPLDVPLSFPGTPIRAQVSAQGAAVTRVDPAE